MVVSQTNPKVSYSSLSTTQVKDRVRMICLQCTTVDEIKRRIKEELGYPGNSHVVISDPSEEGHEEMVTLIKALGGFITADNRAVNIFVWGPDGKTL